MDDAQFDAAALAILRPSWDDRELYATPELQVKALRELADRRAVIVNLRRALVAAAYEMDRRYEMGRAAERERIRRMAFNIIATYTDDHGERKPFADLIGERR
jgi:hypothetical protein